MNLGVIFLAIICIWPTDNTKLPQLIFAQAPTLEVCASANAAKKAELLADASVRAVATSCLELNEETKS